MDEPSSSLISILMPLKNAGTFLDDCIKSIIEQTAQNWELIAVNDHSDDNSLEILGRYAKNDSRIKVLENKGKGIIRALTTAMAASKGIYITRMDADDIMVATKLQKLRKALEERGRNHVVTACVRIFSQKPLGKGFQRYEQWLNELTRRNRNYEGIYKECVIPSPCWMMRRDDLLKIGGLELLNYPEDYDLCFRWYEAGIRTFGIPEVLHEWRDHPDRASRNDPNYADVSFFDLKVPYFLKLDRDNGRALVLWGAGRKGKTVARLLAAHKASFRWVSNNEKKIGKEIYGHHIERCEVEIMDKDSQVLVVVSAEQDQKTIREQLIAQNKKENHDFYFLC